MVLFTHEPFASEVRTSNLLTSESMTIGVKVMVKMTKLTSKSDDDIDE